MHAVGIVAAQASGELATVLQVQQHPWHEGCDVGAADQGVGVALGGVVLVHAVEGSNAALMMKFVAQGCLQLGFEALRGNYSDFAAKFQFRGRLRAVDQLETCLVPAPLGQN